MQTTVTKSIDFKNWWGETVYVTKTVTDGEIRYRVSSVPGPLVLDPQDLETLRNCFTQLEAE